MPHDEVAGTLSYRFWGAAHRVHASLCLMATLSLLAIACAASDATLVGPDVISTEAVEYGATVDPMDGTMYFVRTDAPWGAQGCGRILASVPGADGWVEPTVFLGGDTCYGDPFVSADGQLFLFTSNAHDDAMRKDDDIWVMERTPQGWGEATRIDAVSSTADEYSPVVSSSGKLFFASERSGGLGGGDFWFAVRENQRYGAPVNMGADVNSPHGEWNLYVDPDETYMLFESSGRPGSLSPSGDLYISLRKTAGWLPPVSVDRVNTTGSDLMPRPSRDGRRFFFTSTRNNNNADILSIDTKEILPPRTTQPARTLAVVSRSAHRIHFLDPDTLESSGTQDVGPGPHEIAASPDGRYVFAPAYGVYPKPHALPSLEGGPAFIEGPSGPLTRLDLRQESGVREYETCERSHGVAVGEDGHLWITCENQGAVIELHADTGTPIKHWNLGVQGAHRLETTRSGRYVVVASVEAGAVSIIDRREQVVETIKTGAGAEGLSIAPDDQIVWVGNAAANTISVLDLKSASVRASFPSGGTFPIKLAHSPTGDEVWVVNTFSRSVAIIETRSYTIVETLDFESPPLGILIPPDGKTVYLTFPRLNQVRAFNRVSRKERARAEGIMEADGMVVAFRSEPTDARP